MGIENFNKGYAASGKYTQRSDNIDYKCLLQRTVEEYGLISTKGIENISEYSIEAVRNKSDFRTIYDLVKAYGFNHLSTVSKNEYTKQEVDSELVRFYKTHGFFSTREFMCDNTYIGRTAVESKYESMHEACSKLGLRSTKEFKARRQLHELVKERYFDYVDETESFSVHNEVGIATDDSKTVHADGLIERNSESSIVLEVKTGNDDYSSNIINQCNRYTSENLQVRVVCPENVAYSNKDITQKLLERERVKVVIADFGNPKHTFCDSYTLLDWDSIEFKELTGIKIE